MIRIPAKGRTSPAPENHLSIEQIKAAKPARRGFMRQSLAAAGGAIAASSAGALAQSADGRPLNIAPWTRSLGAPVAGNNGYGDRSKYEANVQRRQSPGLTRTPMSSVSFTPLQSLFGIITPAGLHFERHHSGAPEVDPEQHRLLMHGLVKRPLTLTMSDIMRFPSVSRIHFIECGANSGMEWGNVAVPTVQYSHGMLACSEFTGVLLSTLLEEVGYDKQRGKFILAEGADGSALTRTIPMEFALDDVMVVYGQNGEMLRPENGYPLRLLVPGVQGVSSVKWLRRLEVGDKPWNTREEALHYIDLMPDGMHRQYSRDPGGQVGHHVAIRRAGAARQGLLRNHGPGLVGARPHQARRRVGRWRPQLAAGEAAGADFVQGADAVPLRLELGRQSGAAREPGHRRDRPGATDAGPAARCARHPLHLSQQCN